VAPPATTDGVVVEVGGKIVRSPRRRAYFDSSAAGNLTPVERRGERLQGVTDGDCLVVRHTRPGQPPRESALAARDDRECTVTAVRGLRRDLAAWQERQTAQRLVLLAAGDGVTPPTPEEVADFEESIEVLTPVDGATLTWSESGGQIVLEWSGAGAGALVEYRVGEGAAAVAGRFAADGRRMAFGPFPRGFWEDLAAHGPYRFRVVDPSGRRRSPWREFQVRP
jgi:hypothetical protein